MNYLCFMKNPIVYTLLLFLIAIAGCDKNPQTIEPIVTTDTTNIDDLKINEIQTIGSHNSYRIKTYEPLFTYVLTLAPLLQPDYDPNEWDYTHEPLTDQFNTYQVRSIELDIHYDPAGGQYYYRQGNVLILESADSNVPELLDPGMKVLHLVDFDYMTHHYTFVDALNTVKTWSDANPNHLPLIIMVEAKESSVKDVLASPTLTDVLPFTKNAVDSIDLEIEMVFGVGLDKVITPDDIKGNYATLNEAVLDGAWPTLGNSRGKIIFVLMAGSTADANYLQGHPSLAGRHMFMFSDPGNSEAAFVKFDDPTSNQDTIKALVAAGYMVRTRTDAGTHEARNGDYTRMNDAFSSGAQIISTDYYRPDARADTSPDWTNYKVSFPNNELAVLNPVNGPVEYAGKTINE